MVFKRLIARRIILAVPTAIGVVTVIFAALSVLSPVMRVAFFVDRYGRADIWSAIRQYGLDQPLPVQYVNWLRDVVNLNFGYSMATGEPAMSRVLASLPATLELILYSAPLIIWFGIWLGTRAAMNHNKIVDHIARVIGILGTSFPVFLLGLFLIQMFSGNLWMDVTGRFSPLLARELGLYRRLQEGTFTEYTKIITIDALLNGDMRLLFDAAAHLVLPVGLLVFTQCAALIRVTRSGLIEASGKPYFSSAMAKGLSKKDAIYKHARKNALISVLTISGLLLGNMMTGLIIVETVFGRPGLGWLVGRAARTLDMPVVFACTTLVALVYVLINLVVDILYEYVDPRVRLR